MIAPKSAPQIEGTFNGFATVLVKIGETTSKGADEATQFEVTHETVSSTFRLHCIRRRSLASPGICSPCCIRAYAASTDTAAKCFAIPQSWAMVGNALQDSG